MVLANISTAVAAALSAAARPVYLQTAYGQCGGDSWYGPTICIPTFDCIFINVTYSECDPGFNIVDKQKRQLEQVQQVLTPWAQCGGLGYQGSTECGDGYACTTYNAYYSQCMPGTATPVVAITVPVQESEAAVTPAVEASTFTDVSAATTFATSIKPSSTPAIFSSDNVNSDAEATTIGSVTNAPYRRSPTKRDISRALRQLVH